MHALWGPIRKLDRAQAQIDALEREIDGFLEADRYGIIVAEHNPNTGKYALRARTTSEADPPLRWSIDIGEIAHNLRSCLDHLACQLALTSYPPSDALFEATSFPIYRYGPRSTRPKGERWTDGKRGLTYISRPHRTILEGFQPYQGRNRKRRRRSHPLFGPIPAGRLHPLWLLHEINNADKHRLIQVTARIARGMGLIVRTCPSTFRVNDMSTKLGMKLVDGAYVGTLDVTGEIPDGRGGFEGVDMSLSLEPEIVFWQGCPSVKGLSVIRTLERVHYEVDDIAIRLAKEFPPLDPPWGPPE